MALVPYFPVISHEVDEALMSATHDYIVRRKTYTVHHHHRHFLSNRRTSLPIG